MKDFSAIELYIEAIEKIYEQSGFNKYIAGFMDALKWIIEETE